MPRKWLVALLLAALLLESTGCWNRRELNTLGIAVGYGIDKADGQFRLSVQVVDPGEAASRKGSSSLSPVTIYSATGNSVFEALRRMTKESPRKIYSSHVRILVIGESLAREGISDALDFLSRDHELRNDFYIVVAKDTQAENVLKVLTSLEKIPSINLFNSLETSEKAWAPTRKVTLNELIADLTDEGKQAILTGIELSRDEETGNTRQNVEMIDPVDRIRYSGLAVFNGDKLIGWLNEDESKVYNYVTDHVKSTVGMLNCPQGGQMSVEVIRSQTKVKGKVKDGKPAIDLNVRMEVNVGEVACHVDLTKVQSIDELTKLANQTVEGFIKTAIKKMQKQYKVDIYGFGQVIHRAQPKLWKQIGKDWDAHFVNLPVSVKADTKIRRLGTVSNSFIEEMKK
ncbi:Ger(x)C family spore germination protein [Paenibacillus sp. MBLB4367]|uniref:Ger(x)C family spore germination protein n=1 Tax=Paenibacillus sp. MBLB4367 TaxID=3384767 RepID=UPI0039081B21